MIEYGLTVSLNNSPRTPMTPILESTISSSISPPPLLRNKRQRFSSVEMPLTPLTPPPSVTMPPRRTFADVIGIDGIDGIDGVDGVDGSISPLVPRRLDFVLSEPSPISFRTISLSHASPHSLENSASTTSIGDCGVCYRSLPSRSNHIFTLCGHLFCVRCLLKWWDTNTTCPLCRTELFEEDEEEEEPVAVAEVEAPRIEDPEPSSSETTEEDDTEIQESMITGSTPFIRQYLHTGRFFERSPPPPLWPDNGSDRSEVAVDNIANFDDTRYCISELYALSFDEKAQLRENRQIALNLFGRMVFREMLLSMMVEFRGDVHYDGNSAIPKDQWSSLFYYQSPVYLDTVNIVMYEIVIQRNCFINPDNEINVFGSIKEIRIVSTRRMNRRASDDADADEDDEDEDDADDEDWENRHEYAFIADVFSPSNYYVRSDDGFLHSTPCGSYDMAEGTFSPVEMIIPFSNIRRLYSIRARERIEYGFV